MSDRQSLMLVVGAVVVIVVAAVVFVATGSLSVRVVLPPAEQPR